MKPLIVLIVAFVVCLIGMKFTRGTYDLALSARIALSLMLLFTALAHFKFANGMSMMLPDFIPYKKGIVYFTGVIEIAAAAGILIPGFRIFTGWLLIVFFLMILPANVYAALHEVNYEKGTYDGNGLAYLWFRVPLQFLFILWVYFSCLKYG